VPRRESRVHASAVILREPLRADPQRIISEVLEGIQSGLLPAAALRKAQLECLRGDLLLEDENGAAGRKLDHPFYWAALALSE
jgi:CHAT domain-containing protein